MLLIPLLLFSLSTLARSSFASGGLTATTDSSLPLEILDLEQTMGNYPVNGLPTTLQHPRDLNDRAITFKRYSHVYSYDNLYQWIFGNTSMLLNISVSKCIRQSDVVGVYQFNDGTMKYDATVQEMTTDLGIGKGQNGSLARASARTLENALSASQEIGAFLAEDILVTGSSVPHNKQRRDDIRFDSQGRILALAIKTGWGLLLGVSAAEIGNRFNTTGGHLAAGAITGAGFILVYNIIDILTEEGALAPYEPAWMQRAAIYVANIFLAMLRKVGLLARGAPDNGQQRWTESELAEQLAHEDLHTALAFDTDVTPESQSSFQVEGIQGFECV